MELPAKKVAVSGGSTVYSRIDLPNMVSAVGYEELASGLEPIRKGEIF